MLRIIRNRRSKKLVKFISLCFATCTLFYLYNKIERENFTETTFRFEGVYDGKKYVGKEFNKTLFSKYLQKFGLLEFSKDKTYRDEAIFSNDPVFVSGFSDNYFEKGCRMLTFLKERYNDTKKVYIYDLGLSVDHLSDLNNTFNTVITEIRKFAFHDYPPHVSNLMTYAFKPLIIAEMLKEHGSIWWLDSSAQVNGSLDGVYSNVRKCSKKMPPGDDDNGGSCVLSSPWIFVENSSHNIFSATNSAQYSYLPMPLDESTRNVTMFSANCQLIYGTKIAKRKVLIFWALCALEEQCIAPTGSNVYCSFRDGRFGTKSDCHRYDQSAVNILVAWLNDFQIDRYWWEKSNNSVVIVRN